MSNQCRYMIHDDLKVIKRCQIYNYCKGEACPYWQTEDEQIIPDVIINDHPSLADIENFFREERGK